MDPQPQKSLVIPIALTALVSALVFGGGGYYLGTMQALTETSVVATPTTQSTTTTTATATTTSTTDETANWKTYENKKYGYSLKYPQTRTIAAAGIGGEREGYEFEASDVYFSDEKSTTLEVIVFECTQDQNLDNLITSLDKENESNNIISQSRRTVGGKPAYSFEVKNGYNLIICGFSHSALLDESSDPPLSSPAKITVLPNGKNVVSFIHTPSTNLEGDTILSTFKFTK